MTRPTRALAAAAASLVILAGCNETRLTQLIVVTDTDLMVPGQIDGIAIAIVPPEGLSDERAGSLLGETPITLPATLGVVHRGGPLGPVRISATAFLGDREIVTRTAEVSFVPGESLLLELHLEGSCVGLVCGEGETCAAGACRPEIILRSELRPWDGVAPRLEGGLPCPAEICNEVDDDCDGTADEGFDLAESELDCGACGNECPTYPYSHPECASGACRIVCEDGYGDCDGEPRNGCEVELRSLTMCGECATSCEVDHAIPTCYTGECRPFECAPGWGDCDRVPSNGCESPLDGAEHCSDCGIPCAPANATPTCAGGVCRVASCEPGWADCNGGVEDGCERAIDTVTSCGGCGIACPAVANGTQACAGGRCGVGGCDSGWADCNGSATDGCETALDTMTDCGSCGGSCALPHAIEACPATGCALVTCEPGWGDCNGRADDGCEASLALPTHCGSCVTVCGGSTPLCGESAGGVRECQSSCTATETLCGASCIDVQTSLDHCGACDDLCAPPNASATCTSGACAITACDPGWADCNDQVDDGCERPLDTLSDCGACGATCDLAGAGEVCDGGRCVISMCEPQRMDCDAQASSGCETPIDTLTDCGACSTACALPNATESCAGGTCAITACATGWADCNTWPVDGCEAALGTVAACRSCDDRCDLAHAVEACTAGACAISACDAEFADCNTTASDGCERNIRTPTDCGACGAACPTLDHAMSSCSSGTCQLDRCDPLWGNCDTMPGNGCERSLETTASCGACGNVCTVGRDATASCTGGVCRAICTRPDRADCNGQPADGCERRLDSDEQHCGMCGRSCATGETCENGVCA